MDNIEQKEKVYILQKNLPDGAKAGDKYVWSEKQRRYEHEKMCYYGQYVIWTTRIIEEDTEWFKPQLID